MSQLLEIDGSVLEGGGQILRISISLSAILGVPVRVTNIRAGRSKPGLAAQHLKGIELVAQMCQARLKGASIGSTEIEFVPGKIRGGHYQADTKTAGSISLLLQTALPVALLSDGVVTLDLRGGTNAEMAPQIDYMGEVFRYMLNKFGGDFALDVHRRGYFPKGGGHVTVEVTPVRNLRPATLTQRGEVSAVNGWSFVAGVLPIKMANEMSEAARQRLSDVVSKVQIECYKEDRTVAPDNCSGIILTCETSTGCVLGSDGLGRRGVQPNEVGRLAGDSLRNVLLSQACVDQYTQRATTSENIDSTNITTRNFDVGPRPTIDLNYANYQDQLIVYMALAEGKSSIRAADVTLHTKTAIHVAELIAKTKFTITPSDGTNIIECVGLGLHNTHLPP